MRKVEKDSEIISEALTLKGKTIIDIGCGTGDLVRWLNSEGANAVGLDTPGMLAKAVKIEPEIRDHSIAGLAQCLPFKKNSADSFVYFASLHHIEKRFISDSLKECHRVLKYSGKAVIVEPVGRKGSYFEVVRLVEDEREIQAYAYSVIESSAEIGLKIMEEKFVFFERKYRDYRKLIATFVDNQDIAIKVLSEAKEIYTRFARERGVAWDDFPFRSICRINILEKTG